MEKLGKIPVNEDGVVEEKFIGVPIGTNIEEIWLWLEETYDISVAELIYKGEER